jgi:hypothetical protein
VNETTEVEVRYSYTPNRKALAGAVR